MTNEEKLTQLREMWKTADPDQRKTIEERAQEIKDNIAKEKGMPRRKTIQEMQKDLLKKAAEAKARGFVK